MAHCHGKDLPIEIPTGARKIVLAGNPNSGKSVFFNALTNLYVDVSNYPGTTLEISHGKLGKDVIIDTPGVYGLSSFNDEERIARDIILNADIVLNVVNALHLERDLFLTQQIIDTGIPVVVALNMIDEAEKEGLIINFELLTKELGVPVIPTVAVKRKGIDQAKKSIEKAVKGNPTPEIKDKMMYMRNRVGHQGEALLILEGDHIVAQRHGLEPGAEMEQIYLLRRKRVNAIIEGVLEHTSKTRVFGKWLSRIMIRPITGIPILLFALWLMYQVIGVFVAEGVVGITEDIIMGEYYEPIMRGLVGQFLDENGWLGYILIGEFGVLTMTFSYVIGLLMPLVIGFYLFLSVFEDSGYLPRLAALVDRGLNSIGLNGRAIIPLILGLGCVTMATIVTRILGTEREKRITVFLLALTVPCSAQLGVIAAMLATLGANYALAYTIIIISIFILIGTLLSRFLPGKSSDLLIDLPPLRLPRVMNVLKKTTIKSYNFLKEAFPLFAIGAFLISFLQLTGVLKWLQKILAPLTTGLLDLPPESATAFIMGIVRRDFGAAGLNDMTLEPMQILVALVTITLFVPCIASVMVLFKERGKKEAVIIWLATWVIAFSVGGIIAKISSFSTNPLVVSIVFSLIVLAIAFITKIKISSPKSIERM
ncbi:MAG: ferrous iron transporter B [Desulfitibacter sp. BRH_c19]|nr:MAG: ferrous iron transporter B [Desulfitibacter sp. BRH_c19]